MDSKRVPAGWCLALLLCSFGASAEHYLPGILPSSYTLDQPVKLFVNKLTSTKTLAPYDFYKLPYCRPVVKRQAENLGQILSGDHIENSSYKLEMFVDKRCSTVCRRILKKSESDLFRQAVDEDYRVQMILDNLPVAARTHSEAERGKLRYERGWPVGFRVEGGGGDVVRYMNNHIIITIGVHPTYPLDTSSMAISLEGDEEPSFNIVAFRVEPMSIMHTYSGDFSEGTNVLDYCEASEDQQMTFPPMEITDEAEVIFTYDVRWEISNIPWTDRWDIYLFATGQSRIHVAAILESVCVALFLAGVVVAQLTRVLKKDIEQYNQPQGRVAEEGGVVQVSEEEDKGWKLVHADVFRPPRDYPMLFSVCVGTGCQLMCIILAWLFFALMGALSPSRRGSLLISFILLFAGTGSITGYCSSRIYKMFRGRRWRHATVLGAVLFPGVVFAMFCVINTVLRAEGSSGAVNFLGLLSLLVLWLMVSSPLVYVGSYIGYKQEVIDQPVRTNQIPRQIPDCEWYLGPWATSIGGGLLPFLSIVAQLSHVMDAMWQHELVAIFGTLLVVMLLFIVICALVSMCLLYLQLGRENYAWWWRSFLCTGSSGGYICLYAIWYCTNNLHLDGFSAMLVYFGYMLLLAAMMFLMAGAVGTIASFWFLRTIYSSIKID